LLDDPLPANLPVVPACVICNRGFALDEEYLACFLDCVLAGTTEPEHVRRPRVQQALRHSARLAEQIAASRRFTPGGAILWTPDIARVQSVVLKLARGHALYELGTDQLDAPESVVCLPLLAMGADAREAFEQSQVGGLNGWPEIGSRAFLRAAGVSPYADQGGHWIEVQEGRYRYAVDSDGAIVRIVLAEYLGCAVEWA